MAKDLSEFAPLIAKNWPNTLTQVLIINDVLLYFTISI